MEKRGRLVLFLLIVISIIFVTIFIFYMVLFSSNPSKSPISEGEITLMNPAENLTLEEAIIKFDSSFVKYVLHSIKAYNLHNSPLSSEDPKIEFKVDDDIYSAVVQNSVIIVYGGPIDNPDIRISTTKEEAVKMTESKEYIQQSFLDGRSEIELLASKTTLFAKGYLGLYTELTGQSITGNIIRIYF